MAKEKYPQKKDPLLFLFLLRKNSVKKKRFRNLELEFAKGFWRIKNLTFDKHILQRSYYLIHKI